MNWHFEPSVLATVASWWSGGENRGEWFEGNWYASKAQSNYELKIDLGDSIAVWYSVLQDNVENVAPLVVCSDEVTALRCLVVRAGEDYRRTAGLKPIRIPATEVAPRAPFELKVAAGETPSVSWVDGGIARQARFGLSGRATQFTYYGAMPLDGLIESFQSPDGMPLLGEFVQGR